MDIYLDTSDLINLFQKSIPISPDDFEKKLRTNGHEIVVSIINILEFSAPLLEKNTQTNVMSLLNSIEKMPIKYISLPGINKLELKEALAAFTQGREYREIFPFVNRFDEALMVDEPAPTRPLTNYNIAETIWDLWHNKPSVFKLFQKHSPLLKKQMDSDRTLKSKPSLRDHFVENIRKSLSRYNLSITSQKLRVFSEWIYEIPTRCPSVRLGYEVHHNFLKDIYDIPKQGDMGDLSQINCIPYVDRITFDRRMSHYAKEACRNLGLGYEKRICKNVDEIFK